MSDVVAQMKEADRAKRAYMRQMHERHDRLEKVSHIAAKATLADPHNWAKLQSWRRASKRAMDALFEIRRVELNEYKAIWAANGTWPAGVSRKATPDPRKFKDLFVLADETQGSDADYSMRQPSRKE